MLLLRLTIVYACTLLLPGCITIEDKPRLLGSHGVEQVYNGACATNPATGSRGLNPRGFSVTSWNIYKQQLPGWQADLNRLMEQADILVLQETSLQPELLGWLGERELSWDMSPAFGYRGIAHGVMTAGRSATSSNCTHLHDEPWLGPPKAMLTSYFPIEGSTEQLLLVNIHAVNFTFGPKALEEQLALTLALLEAHPGPVIIAGDFNTWSEARMKVLQTHASELRLSSIDFPGQQPAQYLGRSVDHIYYRGLRASNQSVTPVQSSDHHPLTVTFYYDAVSG